MLNKRTIWYNIKSDNISSILEFFVTINDDLLIDIFLFESIVRLIDSLHEELSVDFFSLVDETISNLIFHEFKRKCCTIETKERWCSCYFSVKDIYIVHHILFWISFYKSNGSTTRESWLSIFNNVFSCN